MDNDGMDTDHAAKRYACVNKGFEQRFSNYHSRNRHVVECGYSEVGHKRPRVLENILEDDGGAEDQGEDSSPADDRGQLAGFAAAGTYTTCLDPNFII